VVDAPIFLGLMGVADIPFPFLQLQYTSGYSHLALNPMEWNNFSIFTGQ
jgi:hypothetical protein